GRSCAEPNPARSTITAIKLRTIKTTGLHSSARMEWTSLPAVTRHTVSGAFCRMAPGAGTFDRYDALRGGSYTPPESGRHSGDIPDVFRTGAIRWAKVSRVGP